MFGAALLIMSELLCEAFDVRPGQRVLDVATGSGNTALAAARRFGELDPTLDPDMPLEEAVAALKRHGETAGISDEVLEMEMEVPATD